MFVSQHIIAMMAEEFLVFFFPVCQEIERNLGRFLVAVSLCGDASGLRASSVTLKEVGVCGQKTQKTFLSLSGSFCSSC